MTIILDAGAPSGATLAQLRTEALFNSFGTRYNDYADQALNKAIIAVCRRLQLAQVDAVVAYDVDGVAYSGPRWSRIDSVWLASGPATQEGQPYRRQAIRPLERLAHGVAGADFAPGDPVGWEALRSVDSTGQYLALRIWPAEGAGFVSVSGHGFPPLMADDSDTSGLGLELDDALVAFARRSLFLREDDAQAAAMWAAEYERVLQTASLARMESRAPRQTPGGEGHL